MKSVVFFLSLVKALVGFALCCHGDEPLSFAAFDPSPVTARVVEFEPLSFAAFDIAPVELPPFTFEAFEPERCVQSPRSMVMPKPAVKPSREVIDYVPPGSPSSIWTHPGGIRQHMQEGMHKGTLTKEQLAMLTDAELEKIHSLQHERRPSTPVAVVAAAPQYNGFTRFTWLDGTTRDTPQPGTNYPTAGGVLVPATTVTPKPTQAAPVSQPVYQSGGCPGGVCPVNRSSGFRLFRSG